MDEQTLERLLIADGWNRNIAVALASNGVTVMDARIMDNRDIMDMWLTYEGIIGYTGQIYDAIDNIETMDITKDS